MNNTIILTLLGLLVGFASGYLPLRIVLNKKVKARVQEHREMLVSGLNVNFKTIERPLGPCTCGSDLTVIEIVPESIHLSTSFVRKTILDPATGKPANNFRAIVEPGKVK